MARSKEASSEKIKKLKADISSRTIGSLYVFYGEETYLRDYYIQQIKKKLIDPSFEAFNFHLFDGKAMDMSELQAAYSNLPAFSERSMILIQHLSSEDLNAEKTGQLQEMIEDVPDYLCMVLSFSEEEYQSFRKDSTLRKSFSLFANTIEFPKQNDRDLSGWIRRRFGALGKEIDPASCEYLIQITDGTMTGIGLEIEKVAAYSSGSRITRKDIDAVVIPQTEVLIYQLTGAVTDQNYGKAIQMIEEMYFQKYDPTMLLSAIGKSLRQLYAAKLLSQKGKGKNELTRMCGMKDYPAELLMRASKNVSLDWCRNAVILCEKTDLKLKSVAGDRNQMLELMILSLAEDRR